MRQRLNVLYRELDLGFGDARPTFIGMAENMAQATEIAEIDAKRHGRSLSSYLVQPEPEPLFTFE